MGCIVRTAGVGRSNEELRWDLDYLLNVWEAIKQVVVARPSPFLIYQDSSFNRRLTMGDTQLKIDRLCNSAA